jgi:hypothetical protein
LIEIPGSVAFVDGFAFTGISLNSVSVSPELRPGFREAFDGSTICLCFGCRRSIVIPSSAVVFGKWNFYWCASRNQ